MSDNIVVTKSPTVLQINTRDLGGGAEKIAWNLLQAYKVYGCSTWLAVGFKHSNEPDILLMPNDEHRSRWARFWRNIGNQLSPYVANVRGAWQLRTLLHGIGQPRWWLDIQHGYEDFDYPGTWQLLDMLPQQPNIVHCHNLHGGYFDLHALPWLSHQFPVALTLHDAWLFSGHCAHSFDCERWKTGCGHCPDLNIYPAILQDKTAYNWRRKQDIFAQSQLYVATPSRWLRQKAEQSMLAPAMVDARVIPNGVDLSVFQPVERDVVRAKLDIPANAKVVLFVASSIRRNIWKDYRTMQAAINQVAEHLPELDILFIALGESAPTRRIGQAEVRFIPYQTDPKDVARYYQAADIYLHAARIDNFPTTILEAMACGVPVVATAVGGIPEQVKSLKLAGGSLDLKDFSSDDATGVLVAPQNADEMAMAVEWLLNDEALCRQLSNNAVRKAHRHFGLARQVEAYLDWYREIIERHQSSVQTASSSRRI